MGTRPACASAEWLCIVLGQELLFSGLCLMSPSCSCVLGRGYLWPRAVNHSGRCCGGQGYRGRPRRRPWKDFPGFLLFCGPACVRLGPLFPGLPLVAQRDLVLTPAVTRVSGELGGNPVLHLLPLGHRPPNAGHPLGPVARPEPSLCCAPQCPAPEPGSPRCPTPWRPRPPDGLHPEVPYRPCRPAPPHLVLMAPCD